MYSKELDLDEGKESLCHFNRRSTHHSSWVERQCNPFHIKGPVWESTFSVAESADTHRCRLRMLEFCRDCSFKRTLMIDLLFCSQCTTWLSAFRNWELLRNALSVSKQVFRQSIPLFWLWSFKETHQRNWRNSSTSAKLTCRFARCFLNSTDTKKPWSMRRQQSKYLNIWLLISWFSASTTTPRF